MSINININISQILKNRFRPSAVIGFLRYHRKKIAAAIFAIVIIYGAFVFYSYAFRPIWFPKKIETENARLNKNLYDEIWQNFSKRAERLEEGMNGVYNDPFR